MEKVVKCKQCDKFFMYTPKDKECPFCRTLFVFENTKENDAHNPPTSNSLQGGRKITINKNKKDSFKMWNNN